MKTIVKIEIALLVLVLLVGTGMVLVSEGVLDLFFDPVILEQTPEPIPTEEMEVPAQEAAEESTDSQSHSAEEEGTDAQAHSAEERNITATKYFAYDVREGEYLAIQGGGDDKLYPASITKLLTVHVLLSAMDPADKVNVGDAMSLVQEDSSLAGLKEGDTLTVEQLIAAMMLPSGNDAAQVAAAAAGRKLAGDSSLSASSAVQVFVKEMNAQAQALGMANSHFENPDGFHHENHYTTMNDLVILCKAVLANETVLKYTSMASDAVVLSDRTLEWDNTNYLLHSGEETYLSNTIGLKTGYTSAAGSCLVSAFFMEDRLLLIGVFGCPAYTEDRYLDTVAIYNSLQGE